MLIQPGTINLQDVVAWGKSRAIRLRGPCQINQTLCLFLLFSALLFSSIS